MIELKDGALTISFPEVHPDCVLEVTFQRTLRIPDDGKSYPLPPSLGDFAVRHVDDFAAKVPDIWNTRGGVMLPMYPTEALWLNFDTPLVQDHWVGWPFALKVAAGKINAVDGEQWTEPLNAKQDYLAVPEQPWLDGFFAGKGKIRQFVAMQQGRGYTVEEQLTGSAEHGGLQLIAYPMKREEFERRFPKHEPEPPFAWYRMAPAACAPMAAFEPSMGLAAGGSMEQEIEEDPYGIDAYDTSAKSRCFVHLCNAMVWRSVTGKDPAHPPPTAADYNRAGLPWFDYTNPKSKGALGKTGEGSWLDKVKSVVGLAKAKGETALPENESLTPTTVLNIGPKSPDEVRDGEF